MCERTKYMKEQNLNMRIKVPSEVKQTCTVNNRPTLSPITEKKPESRKDKCESMLTHT